MLGDAPRGPVSASDLPRLFRLFNQRYFDGEIEPSRDFFLRFTRSVKLSGCFRFCLDTNTDLAIEISGRLRDHPRALRSTLVHEMIHMLAHQRYRQGGGRHLLDEHPLPGSPFVNPGHGAFFLAQLERLNTRWPELGISVKSTFGDHLYECDRIPPRHLLAVTIDSPTDKGMIYSLHPSSRLDTDRLSLTARQLHPVRDLHLLQVRGELAEGYPMLRRDDAPRRGMRIRSLRQFRNKLEALLAEPETADLLPSASDRKAA